MIEVESLWFQYEGADAPAVTDVTFEVPAGSIIGFLGPSGSGKSTVQKVLTRLLPRQKGNVRYDGISLQKLDREFMNQIGVSFEHPNLFPRLTGRENLLAYAGLYTGDKLDVDELLDRVGLASARDRKAEDYSKGMKQRLVFARALVHQPRFLFLDEPTSGLDPATAREIMKLIAEQRERGSAIILTTHDMFVADTLSDEVAFLHGGEIVARGSPRSLKLEHGERAVEVEYNEGGEAKREHLSLASKADLARLATLTTAGHIETLHSQEATLEQIFVKLTGSELAA